ncbi:MAG: serine hydrolase [Methylococcales bacterium]|nr:serine hydrolase [Methylococcales bacterium]
MNFTLRTDPSVSSGINTHKNGTNVILFWFFVLLLLPALLKAQDLKTHINEYKITPAITELEKKTVEKMQQTGLPGLAIGIVYQDRVLYHKGFGVREADKPGKVDADTVFQLASLSKPLGSTVIAGLVSDGVMAWSDLVSRYEPDFALNDTHATQHLTIGDMYSHRSGLPEHAGDMLEDMGYDRAEVLHRLRFIPIGNRFRNQYAYTNFGLTAGAVAAANAAKKKWEDLSEARLYKPLGMMNTSSRYNDFINNPNHAAGHVMLNGKWVFREQRQPDAQSPAGGASSSINDMAQWLRLHISQGKIDGKQLISAKALQETYSPPIDPATKLPASYALGWGVGHDDTGHLKLSHSGAFSMGAATTVIMLPEEKLGIIILTNTSPFGVPEALALSFIELVTRDNVDKNVFEQKFDFGKKQFEQMRRADLSKTDYANPPENASPAFALENYAGTYANDYIGPIEIVNKAGKLLMTQGPLKNHAYPLTHYDGNLFFYETRGENEAGLSGVRFNVDKNSKATTLWVENLDAYGMGTLIRQP